MITRQLKNKHVTRFGFPITHDGALYIVSDEEGLCQMAVDLFAFQLLRYGETITPEMELETLKDIRFERDIYKSRIAKIGIPNKLEELFQIKKKSNIGPYCKNLSISEYELYLLIHNCVLLGYSYESRFPDFIPNHLKISDADTQAMKDGKPNPLSKKIHSLLKERKVINVHFFTREQEWHCIYFTYKEIDKDLTHWKNGSHIHYINHLWPNFSREQVWNSFDTRKTYISGSIHIRFEPFEYPPMKSKPDNLLNSCNPKPGGFAFDLRLIENIGKFPTPSAQLAARGIWITKVSI